MYRFFRGCFFTVSLLFCFVGSNRLNAEPLRVYLDWFLNPDHGPLVIARERGYFAEVGLEVELIEPSDPNDPPKLIAAGHGDVAISYQPQLHIQAANALPITRFGTLIATPLNSLVVLADGPIKTLNDLRGSKIGFSVGGFEEAILGTMLQSVGVGLDEVTLININFALTPALMQRQVEGVIGAFRNFELNQLELKGKQGRAFYPEDHGVPPYDELIFITHRQKITDPRLPRFLDAVEKATLFLVNHPQTGWQIFIKSRPTLDDALNRKAWVDTVPRFCLSPGALNWRRYGRFANFLFNRGVIDRIPFLHTYTVSLP